MVGKDTAVLSLQNGWGNAPRIADIVGQEPSNELEATDMQLQLYVPALYTAGELSHPCARSA